MRSLPDPPVIGGNFFDRELQIAALNAGNWRRQGEELLRHCAARKDIRTVSTLLRRLVNRGAVIVEGTGRKRMYVASERLYSIYYKLRRERDEAAVVANLIYFMAVFYSKAELAEMSDRLIAEAAESKVIREGFERAITEQPQVGSVFSNMARSSIDQASNLATSMDPESIKRLFEEIITALDEGAFEKVIETVDQAFAAWSANWSRVPEPLIAAGFFTKALAHEQLDDYAVALASYDEVITRFGDSDVPALQVLIALAFSKKGDAQVKLDEITLALASYDEVIECFGSSNVPALQFPVAWALCQKGNGQIEIGHTAEALQTCEELERRLDTLPRDEKAWIGWQAMYMRVRVLMVQKKRRGAMDAFRSAYAAFPLNDDEAMRDMQMIVPELIASGASERDLVEILSSDKGKSGALAPLIVALRERTGEEVRAPVEVLEVAKDINKHIDAKTAN